MSPLHVYIDTSSLLALAFREPECNEIENLLDSATSISSSQLLVPESAAAFERNDLELSLLKQLLEAVTLLDLKCPFESIEEVLHHGHVRGADLLHLVTAIGLSGRDRGQLLFLTHDSGQAVIAEKLGFKLKRPQARNR